MGSLFGTCYGEQEQFVRNLSLKGRCGRPLQRHLVYCHFLIQIYFKMRLSTINVFLCFFFILHGDLMFS